MKVEQMYDTGLAHASYCVVSEGQMAVVDPARDPQPYFDFAKANNAKIVAVFMTHPHADFVASHTDIAKVTGAKIYHHANFQAGYSFEPFTDGETVQLGKITFKALNTPGHTPDSITVQLFDEDGISHAIFSGDTLFVGDVGRPDLLDTTGRPDATREVLARSLYRSLRNKIMTLPADTLVYPAHGAGSLCGKALSEDRYSTLDRELKTNYALQPMTEDEFVQNILADQPFVPKYFIHNVLMNKRGPEAVAETLAAIPRLAANQAVPDGALVIDARPQTVYKAGHAPRAINIQTGGKFETWLGSVLGPDEKFYLIASNEQEREELLLRAAKIGYEINILGAYAGYEGPKIQSKKVDLEHFNLHPADYTILDTRDNSERKAGHIFANSIHIPLNQLRERIAEVPTDKPIVVHCAGGYRSATGCSILRARLPQATIFDLSESVKEYDIQPAH